MTPELKTALTTARDALTDLLTVVFDSEYSVFRAEALAALALLDAELARPEAEGEMVIKRVHIDFANRTVTETPVVPPVIALDGTRLGPPIPEAELPETEQGLYWKLKDVQGAVWNAPTRRIFPVYRNSHLYARPLQPSKPEGSSILPSGAEWRDLGPEEVPRKGDEFNNGIEWRALKLNWCATAKDYEPLKFRTRQSLPGSPAQGGTPRTEAAIKHIWASDVGCSGRKIVEPELARALETENAASLEANQREYSELETSSRIEWEKLTAERDALRKQNAALGKKVAQYRADFENANHANEAMRAENAALAAFLDGAIKERDAARQALDASKEGK